VTFQTVGILALVLDVAAIASVFRAPADGATRRTWTLFIVLLPFIGAIFYFGTGARRPAVGWNSR
jgi:hypothetical protein